MGLRSVMKRKFCKYAHGGLWVLYDVWFEEGFLGTLNLIWSFEGENTAIL